MKIPYLEKGTCIIVALALLALLVMLLPSVPLAR